MQWNYVKTYLFVISIWHDLKKKRSYGVFFNEELRFVFKTSKTCSLSFERNQCSITIQGCWKHYVFCKHKLLLVQIQFVISNLVVRASKIPPLLCNSSSGDDKTSQRHPAIKNIFAVLCTLHLCYCALGWNLNCFILEKLLNFHYYVLILALDIILELEVTFRLWTLGLT